MEKLPKTVGEIIRIGQWLHTAHGREFLADCTALARAEFGESPNVHRLCQSWGCAIFSARKVKKKEFISSKQSPIKKVGMSKSIYI